MMVFVRELSMEKLATDIEEDLQSKVAYDPGEYKVFVVFFLLFIYLFFKSYQSNYCMVETTVVT